MLKLNICTVVLSVLASGTFAQEETEFVDVPIAPTVEEAAAAEEAAKEKPAEEGNVEAKKPAESEAAEEAPASNEAVGDEGAQEEVGGESVAPAAENKDSVVAKKPVTPEAENGTVEVLEEAAKPSQPIVEENTPAAENEKPTEVIEPVEIPETTAAKPAGEAASDAESSPSIAAVQPLENQLTKVPNPKPLASPKPAVVDNVLPPGHFSPTLGARFAVRDFKSNSFGTFRGVQITSVPLTGSPLKQIGLTKGDIVTRLDGARVLHREELEIHVNQTFVRFIRGGTGKVQEKCIHIDEYHFFREPGKVSTASHSTCSKPQLTLLP